MANHVCPVWLGWWLASPIRKLLQNPDKILSPYIKEGMIVLEPGCAMGFFSLPAARLAGPQGKVIGIDMQEGMLKGLKKRAARAGLLGRIETRICGADSLGIGDLQARVDFAFAIAVVHEVPDAGLFFQEIARALKPQAKLLLAEPKGHITPEAFNRSLDLARQNGFRVLEQGVSQGGRTAVLEKN